MTIEEARELMHQWISNPALRVHMECVAACMGAYAQTTEPGQVERWRICGLLHDMDWEKHPTREAHPFVAVKFLRERKGFTWGKHRDTLRRDCERARLADRLDALRS